MARWRLRSPASRLFTQPFIQAQIKETITGHRWIPAQKASHAENIPFDDVIMYKVDICWVAALIVRGYISNKPL